MSAVRAGIIGMGFMGRTHAAAYLAASEAGYPCELSAVCDPDERRRRGESDTAGNLETGATDRLFDPDRVKGFADVGDLLADDDIDLISICTPTDTHAELSIRALEAARHVLVEKPVALSSVDVLRVADAARNAGRLCMPAMCMRFWPAWSWLKERIDDGSLGTVRSATFRRLGTRPTWGDGFYADSDRCGGALMDLHIHDADFILHCFGRPTAVSATGSTDHVTALYRFENGPAHVVAEGGWDHTPGFDFRMRYTVVFEKATVDFDLTRDEPLKLFRDGHAESVSVDPLPGYDHEIRHLVNAIAVGGPLLATLDDACAVADLLDAERRSFETGEPIRL